MIDQTKRIRELFKEELNRIKLGDVVGFAVEGPQYVPSQQGITVGWMLMITLKHNVLLGQEDIGVTVPVMGVLPPDDVFRQGAQYILDEARKLRYQASRPDVAPDGAIEGTVVRGPDGAPQPIPAGLIGKDLAGIINHRGG